MATPLEPDRPPRQLIVCCDGTNNTLTAGTQDTNVLRLVTHLAAHPSPHRLVYYDPGVGTPDAAPPTDPMDWAQRTWERISGLASGRGVYDNIAAAYLFLMQSWRDHRDRIYLFGFSRGAFTVRGVAGMVNLFGILEPDHAVLLPTLLSIYFSQPGDRGGSLQKATYWVHQASRKGLERGSATVGLGGAGASAVTRERLGQQVRDLFTTPAGHDAWVHWIGVWDTVESVGLPGPLSRTNPSTATLHGKRLRHVRHALAFDEHRWTFEPRLYEEPGDVATAGQTLKQRWFAGVHCDVGGSYPRGDRQLADEALQWMVAEVAQDLAIPPLPAGTTPRVRHDALWDTPWWALAGMCLRNMQPRTANGDQPIAVIPGPWAALPSTSVWDTRRQAWPLAVALLIGTLCLLLSGACLTPQGWSGLWLAGGLGTAVEAARSFAADQLASLWWSGLLAAGHAPWQVAPVQTGWAMFWDFGFIAGWGYLLARVGSRSFAWLAGTRGPASPLPRWRALGMAPLAAVGGDACENLFTLAALAAHAAGTDAVAYLFLWLAGASALCKFSGLIACLPLLAVRCWIAMPGVPRRR